MNTFTLNKIGQFWDRMKRDERISNHFIMDEKDFDNYSKLTENQFMALKYLMNTGHIRKKSSRGLSVYDMLLSLKIKPSERKHGLKDECGNFTDEAKQIVINKLTEQNTADQIAVAKAMEAEESYK